MLPQGRKRKRAAEVAPRTGTAGIVGTSILNGMNGLQVQDHTDANDQSIDHVRESALRQWPMAAAQPSQPPAAPTNLTSDQDNRGSATDGEHETPGPAVLLDHEVRKCNAWEQCLPVLKRNLGQDSNSKHQNGKDGWDTNTLMALIMEQEAPGSNKCDDCSLETVDLYRCRDCFGGSTQCKLCAVKCHARTPFHRLERWTGHFFDRETELGPLGLGIHCGHRGAPCPHMSTMTGRHKMQIIDINGTFAYNVYECRCAGARPFAQQLMLMKILAATPKDPKTGFTFSVLKEFEIFNTCGKVSINDYFGAVTRKTNAVQPHTVKVSPARTSRMRQITSLTERAGLV